MCARKASPNPMLTTTPEVSRWEKRQSEAESTMASLLGGELASEGRELMFEGPSLGVRKRGRRVCVREPAHAKAVQQLLLGVCPPSLAPSAAGGAEAAVPVACVLERLRDDGGVCGERGAPTPAL